MKDDIKLPPLPEGDIYADTCPAMRVHTDQQLQDYARLAIKADRQHRGEPEYRISACYFPKAGEVELSWERQYDGAKAHLTFKATPDQGKSLVSVIDPCVYYTAAPQPAAPKFGEEND